MKMPLNSIFEHLYDHYRDARIFGDKNHRVAGILPASRYKQADAEKYIYLFDYKENPPYDCYCVLLREQAVKENICKGHIIINKPANSLDILLLVQDFFNNINFYENQLLSAALSCDSVQTLLDSCKDYFQNPVIIFDSTYKMLAYSEPILAGFESGYYKWINNDLYLDYEYVIRKSMEYSNSEDIFHNLKKHAARFVENTTDDRKLISCYVMENDLWSARIIAGEEGTPSRTPLKEAHLPMLDLLGKCILIFLKRELKITENTNYLYATFFTNILNRLPMGESLILYHLNLLEWKNDDIYTVYVLDKATALTDCDEFLKKCLGNLSKILPYAKIIIYEQKLVMIINNNERTKKEEEQNSLIYRFAVQNKFFCGQSLSFTDFFLLKEYYLQAVSALSLGMQVKKSSSVSKYEDYLFLHILADFGKLNNLKLHIHPAIRRLHEYDTLNNSDLCETLYMYLMNGRSHAQSAKKLYIHRGTFQYRLNKVLDLITEDLENEEIKLNLLCSLQIIKYLNANIQLR